MNYRHIYHAGNFADVFKHTVLIALINHLKKKPTGFCYYDTHAGVGYYQLDHIAAKKTAEHENGINQIFHREDAPTLVKDYLTWIRYHNPTPDNEPCTLYPGSPALVRHLLRAQDRMVLSELHPEDYSQLRKLFLRDPQVGVHHQDGYLNLKGLLPPKEKRGLVLIDPSYEDKNEFEHIIRALKLALHSWSNGIYAIWYPIKAKQSTKRFLERIQALAPQKTLIAELMLYPLDSPQKLNGTGMIIINPPFQLQEELDKTISWLRQALLTP